MPNKTQNKQYGFAMLEIILIGVVVLAIGGFVAWRVITSNSQSQANIVTGSLTAEDRKKIEAEQAKELAGKTPEQQSTISTTPTTPSTTPTTQQTSKTTTTTPKTTTPPTSSTPPTQTTSPAPASTPAPTPAPSTITRPTTASCQTDSSPDAWTTDNSSHTYQVWENGGWASKTETGTAALNYDTMQVVGVIPYLKKASWANCSDKAGYITFYYNPPGSVYTYNWLVPFSHISITQP